MRPCIEIWSRTQAPRVALAVHALVMRARDRGHVAQRARVGQLLEHLDRGDHVVVDDLALARVQRAARDAQVLDLLAVRIGSCSPSGARQRQRAAIALHALPGRRAT